MSLKEPSLVNTDRGTVTGEHKGAVDVCYGTHASF